MICFRLIISTMKYLIMFNKKSLEKLPIIYCLGYPFKVPNDIHTNSDSIFDLIKNNVDALKHSEFHLALNLIE